MSLMSTLRGPVLAALAAGAVVAASASAFTASNTVPVSNAGDGSATISGFAVTNVKYALNATNPAMADSVQFDLAPIAPGASAPVSVQVMADGTHWNIGVFQSGTTWKATLNESVASLANLEIVAAQ